MKKELYIPLIIFSLTLIYLILSAVASLTNNKPFLLKYKLKIATLIIAFNSMVFGTKLYADRTCYLGPPLIYDPTYLGLNFESNINLSKNLPIPISDYDKKINDKNSKGLGYSFGLSYLYYFERYTITGSAINFNLEYHNYIGGLTQNINSIPITINGEQKQLNVLYHETYNISSIFFDALYNYCVIIIPSGDDGEACTSISIGTGVDLGFIIHNNLLGKNTSDLPLTYYNDSVKVIRYEDSSKTAVVYDSNIKDINKFMLGTKAELNCKLDWEHIMMSFTLGYNYYITKITSNWQLSDFYLGLKFYYKFNKE